MIIKKLKIDDFEDVEHLELSFSPQVISLEMPVADTVRKAVAVILKSVRMKDFAGDLCIKPGTSISAEIDINGEEYFVTARGSPETGGFEYDVRDDRGDHRFDFYDMIHVCEEEDRLSCFHYDEGKPYSRRLKQYKDIEKYYPEGVFSEITDGIGCTRTFRALLNEYIKGFRYQRFPIRDDRRVAIRNDGEFVLTDSGGAMEPISLTEGERKLFEYMCFLYVNDFWKRVELVRDINHVSRPVMIPEGFCNAPFSPH